MKSGEWSRALQRWGETPSSHPLTRPAVTLSPTGGEGRGEGAGSWEGGRVSVRVKR